MEVNLNSAKYQRNPCQNLAALCLVLVASCSLRSATKEECAAAAKHAIILHAGENASLGAGLVEAALPGVMDRFLTPVTDICVARARKADTDCIIGARTETELKDCAFYVEHWKGL